MNFLTPALLAATIALSATPTLAKASQGPDIEASTRMTMKECLNLQAAKHDGASLGEMREACRWTTDQVDDESALRNTKPRALDAYSYGVLPDRVSASSEPR